MTKRLSDKLQMQESRNDEIMTCKCKGKCEES